MCYNDEGKTSLFVTVEKATVTIKKPISVCVCSVVQYPGWHSINILYLVRLAIIYLFLMMGVIGGK